MVSRSLRSCRLVAALAGEFARFARSPLRRTCVAARYRRASSPPGLTPVSSGAARARPLGEARRGTLRVPDEQPPVAAHGRELGLAVAVPVAEAGRADKPAT